MTDRILDPIRQMTRGATEHAVKGYKAYILPLRHGGVRLMVFQGGLIYTHRYSSEREALAEMHSGDWKKRKAREAKHSW
jgi:hypothetical protein